MAKVVLNTIASRYGSIDALNANFSAIEDAFQNTLSRDGSGPNALEANLDAGFFRIINLPVPVGTSDAATKAYVDEVTSILSDYVEQIDVVADNIDAVITVSQYAETLTDNINAIQDVSSNIEEVVGVANNIGSVELVGLDLNGNFQQGVVYDFGAITDPAVGEVETTTSSIVIVANDIVDVKTVADNIESVVAVADNLSSIITVEDNETNINTVASINSDVSIVAAISEDVTAVAENTADISAVVDNEVDISAVAGNNSNITAVAGNATNINAVASNATNINAVAANESDIDTVASSISSVNTVASNNTNVSTVATSIADVSTVAANIIDVQNAEENADAAIAAQVAAEAARDAALAALDSFDDRYLGQKSTAPTVDNDGDPLVSGALYFNTVDNIMYVWDGVTWLAAYASLSGALLATNNLSDLTNASTARGNLGLGGLATLSSVGTTEITNNAVTVDKLAATLDYGSIA